MARKSRTYPPLEDRFWAKVNKARSNECWEWTAYRNKKGYGVFWNGSSLIMAHRYSYIINVGELIDGMLVMHTCDNPGCVNPGHLKMGTNSDNMQDMIIKGRQRVLGGDLCPHAKLTSKQVLYIRSVYRPYYVTLIMLAKMFGVSRTSIKKIVYRKSWKETW